MLKPLILTSALVLVSMLAPIHAEDTRPATYTYESYGVGGNVECGKMTSQLRANRKISERWYSTYIAGFTSGANFHAWFERRGNPKVGIGTSNEALLAETELYCAQHPLQTMADALQHVYTELVSKR